MTNQPSPTEFSFDLYPGLDSELDDAYRRNVENGTAQPGEIATSGLAAAVQQNLQPPAPDISSPNIDPTLPEEVRDAIGAWDRYGTEIGRKSVPKRIDYLVGARKDLGAQLTPEDRPIAESMKLVLIPWLAFKNNLNDIPDFIQKLRTIQGIATSADYINPTITKAITDGQELYRNPVPQTTRNRFGRPKPEKPWISAEEYLDKRIAMDGAWGAMMVQASNEAGLKDLLGKSPDNLTGNGETRFGLSGHEVDGLGIFEWLALTLAEDPSQLSRRDWSWMLANRVIDEGSPCVPGGSFYDGRVRSVLYGADDVSSDIRPRLAVIGKGL
jgi:hypothetical protein